MDTPTVFYIVGSVLTVLAIVVSALGLREKAFPGSSTLLAGVAGVFVVLVAGTAATAVLAAREEQEHRRAELAEEEAIQEAAEEGEQEAAQTGEEGPAGAPPEEEIGGEEEPGAEDPDSIATPEEGPEEEEAAAGALQVVDMFEYGFDPEDVVTAPGERITADNTGEIVHNLTVVEGPADDFDEILLATEDVQPGNSDQIRVNLEIGEYTMVCTIPGHIELGMVGSFTVE